MNKKGPKNSIGYVIRNNLFLFKMSFRACPGRIIGEWIYWVFHYAVNLFWSIIFLQYLVESIEKKRDFQSVLLFLGLSLVFLGAESMYGQYFKRIICEAGNQKLYERLHLRMFEKAADVELECYENPEFYNRYTKAASQIKGRAYQAVTMVPQIVCIIISSIFLVIRTMQIDRFAVIFSLFPILSAFIIGGIMNNIRYELYQKNVESERQKEYVKRTMYLQEYAKEIRLSNIYNVLQRRLEQSVGEIVANTKRYGLRLTCWGCLQGGISQLFVSVASIIYAAVRLVYFRDIRVSEFVVLVNAVMALAYNLIDTAKMLNKMQENSLYIQNIREFLEYKPRIAESQEGCPVSKAYASYEVDDVSFTYSGQKEPVLKHISLQIRPGEKIALVGENGAGKTTLVKLLLRLYDPAEGEIRMDGRNIKDYNVRQYREMFAAVFQDYKVLSMTVAENVLLKPVSREERGRVREALRAGGVCGRVERLPKGMDTVLTREFDPEGAVLSGGETQKIALARAFAGDSQIAVLDEPSSALDPIAEYQMYESMLRVCGHKSVVFISHRLSSAVLADRIYVLEHGEIIESGSHAQLMEKNGKYAAMFGMQAQNYR